MGTASNTSSDGPCSLIIAFDSGEDIGQQEAWVHKNLAAFGLAIEDIQYERVDDCSCCLTFPAFEPYARFRFNILGDLKKGRGHSTLCAFDFEGALDTEWIEAARAFCARKNFHPAVKIEGGVIEFEFDFFRQMALFRIAVQKGEVDGKQGGEPPTYERRKPLLRPYDPSIR